uniref:Uncharacterized protein n=1 Tax=Ditylenchus dipsaci TaxID=166011 RepID=A0A915D218_9BILA
MEKSVSLKKLKSFPHLTVMLNTPTSNCIKQRKNSKKAENDIQMTLTLILQAILPFIAGCIGICASIGFVLLSICL